MIDASDPTAVATLGLLLLVRRARWPVRALWVLPLAWCLLSLATLWTMGSVHGWVLCAAALLAVAAAWLG